MDKPFPTLREIECAHIRLALGVFKQKKVAAARALGIAPATLYRKLSEYKIEYGEDVQDKSMLPAWERPD